MHRRTFVKDVGIIGGMTITALSCSSALKESKYQMGYQLYSIRDEMGVKPIETLQALKAMGYSDFEIYGFDADKGTVYGFTPTEFKGVVDDLGLSVSSGHYGFSPFLHKSDEDLKRFVDQCIKAAKEMDSKYITWPWLAPELRTLDNFKLMSHKLNVIGEQVSKAGLGFAYHNHGFEFEDHNGEQGFDIIINETDPSIVKLQIDMYWVMHSSNYTPQELIDAQPGRYVMWHIKDMDKITRDYTELGNGSIDYTTLLPDPITSGLEYYFIEQGGNYATNSLTSASDSAEYFKSHLQSRL